MFHIQVTLEQHGIELHRPTNMQIFFFNKYDQPSVSVGFTSVVKLTAS